MTESFWPLWTSFLNVLKRASLTGEKWWVSTNGHSWLGSDNAIPEGVGSWALDPFGPGERVTLGRGLVNQLVAPLVEVSGPFFFRCLGYTFGIPQKGIFLYFPQSSLYARPPIKDVIRRGIRPRGISIGTSPSDFARRRSRHSPRAMRKDVDRSPQIDNYIEGLYKSIYYFLFRSPRKITNEVCKFHI